MTGVSAYDSFKVSEVVQVYLSTIRFIIIMLSVCLLIVIDPSRWMTPIFALLQENNVTVESTLLGVVDRIEKQKATILIDSEKKEMIINPSYLPDKCGVGTWLLINKYSDGSYVINVQSELTNKNKEESKYLMEQLLKKQK